MALELLTLIGLADTSKSLLFGFLPSREWRSQKKYKGDYKGGEGYYLSLKKVSYKGNLVFIGKFPSEKINGQENKERRPVPLRIDGRLNGDIFEGHYIFEEKTWSTETYDYGVIYGRYYKQSFFLAFENRSYDSRWKGIGAEYTKVT